MTSPHPTFHPFLCKREGGKKEQVSSPSPAPRQRGFPLPLWRGVNGLASYVSLPFPAGRGWGCLFGCWRTGHRDPVLLWLAWQISVGRWPPCPVLQQEARVFTPLHKGRGKPRVSAARGWGFRFVYLCNIGSVF